MPRGTRRPYAVWLRRRQTTTGTTWAIRWIDPDTGAERSLTAGTDRDVARELAARKRQELKAARTGAPAPLTIIEMSHCLPIWMAGNAPETLAATTRSLRRLAELTENRLIHRISRDQLLAYRAARLAQHAAPATVNKELREISSALSLAVDAGRLDHNPLLHWARGKLQEPQRRIRVIEPHELEALIAAARSPGLDPLGDDQMAGILILGWYMGLRRREACQLRWEAVDLPRRQLYVQNYLTTGQPAELTKNRRLRVTPLRSAAYNWLAARWDRVPKQIENGQIRARIPTVFAWPENGRPVQRHWLSHHMARLVAAARIPPATYHDLRRSFSTLAQRAGIDAETVRQLGGWSNLEVVRRHYTGEIVEPLRAAIEKLDHYIA